MYLASILFYSNYSDVCKQLMLSLDKCPVNFQKIVGLNYVCIDNKKIRHQIISSKKFKLREVPTLLVIHENGSLEKLENTALFNWIDYIVNQNLPPSYSQPAPCAYAQPIVNHPVDLPLGPELNFYGPPPPPPPPPPALMPQKEEQVVSEPPIFVPPSSENIDNSMSDGQMEFVSQKIIEENDSISEQESQMNEYIERTNIVQNEEKKEGPKDATSAKSEHLMAAAMAMQKERGN